MAITFNEEHVVNSETAGVTGTDDITIAAGTDRIAVFVAVNEGSNAAHTVTTATLGAASWVDILTENTVTGNGNICLYMGYILDANIPAGSNTNTITWSGGNVKGGGIFVFDGAAQTSPVTASDSDGVASANPAALSLAGGSSGDVVVTVCGCNGSVTLTVPTSHTEVTGGDWAGGTASGSGSYFITTDGSTQTPDWTFSGGTRTAQGGVLIAQASAGASVSDVNLHGVGRGISRGVARGVG